MKQQIKTATKKKSSVDANTIIEFEKLNPEFWETYAIVGDYFAAVGINGSAVSSYKFALTKEINDTHETDKLKEKIQKLPVTARVCREGEDKK